MNQSGACSLLFVKTNKKDACFRVPQSSSLPQSCAKEERSGVEIVVEHHATLNESRLHVTSRIHILTRE